MWDETDVRLVPYEWLKPHEEIKPRNRDKLLEMTLRWGGFTKPLVVDKRTGAIRPPRSAAFRRRAPSQPRAT